MNEATPQRDWLKDLQYTIENIESLKASLEEQLHSMQTTVKELKAECECAKKAIGQMKLAGVPEDSSKRRKERKR